ncbi:MAG: Uma2 family endonuclease [Prochloron sp. SP5CPC1]|nr:Uma2 family endonuclease [Candidatus Paraprochloron terpiosi SP5CPC1]
MISQLSAPTKAEIIYPDNDSQPMANNTIQFRWILVIQQNLDWLLAENANAFVAGDLFWYPIEGNNTIVNAPDVMVVLGRPKGDRLSYKQWEEDGIAPQVVFEILSPSNTGKEMAQKLLFYDRQVVREYYIYDPHRNELQGWLRGEYGLDSIESMVDWISPLLGIRFSLSKEELQIYRPDHKQFLSYIEISQQLKSAEQQLEQERKQTKTMEDLLNQYRDRFGELQ